MPSITIRNVSEASHRRLRIRAAENGRSMQEEIKMLIDAEIQNPKVKQTRESSNWVDDMRQRIRNFGYVEFDPPPLDETINVPDFSGKDFDK